MADVNKDKFTKRLDALKQKSNPQKRVEKRVREDGLIVDVVKTDIRKRGLVPIKGFLFVAFLFVGFKGFLFAELGEPEYLQRIDGLKKGSTVEVSAAFLLDADPATRAVAKVIGKLLR